MTGCFSYEVSKFWSPCGRHGRHTVAMVAMVAIKPIIRKGKGKSKFIKC